MEKSELTTSNRPGGLPQDADAKFSSKWCEQLLDELSQAELEDLAAYARLRLNRVGLERDLAEDVRQNAILSVLLGSRSNLRGRHPRKADMADRRAFRRYLKGIICSMVEARYRSRENRSIFISLDFEMMSTEGPTTHERVAVEDLAQQLFNRLQNRVPERLQPVLRQWAAHWRECDVIPLVGKHRRHRQELRALAVKVLGEMTNPGAGLVVKNNGQKSENHE